MPEEALDVFEFWHRIPGGARVAVASGTAPLCPTRFRHWREDAHEKLCVWEYNMVMEIDGIYVAESNRAENAYRERVAAQQKKSSKKR